MNATAERLRYLRALDAHNLDLSMLPAERRRFLASVQRRSTSQALERREPQRRYPVVLALIGQSVMDVMDQLIAVFDLARRARRIRPGRRSVKWRSWREPRTRTRHSSTTGR